MNRVSEAKLNELKEKLEYHYLRREELNIAWRKAVEEGDDRETDALTLTLELMKNNELSIIELKELISNTKLVESTDSDKVTLGNRVKVKIGKNTQTVTVVDPIEADPNNNKLSIKSPIGDSILGKKAGETTYYKTPLGEKISVKILEIL